MQNENSITILKINLKYGDLEANFEGDYLAIWKFTNDFLNRISQNDPLKQKNMTISLKNKSVPISLMDLRNRGFFNQSRSSHDCQKKFKELGRTDVKIKVIMMALKRLVEDGELKRQEDPNNPGQFLYLSPYI